MKEPPGFPPVECNLERDEHRFRAVVVELPLLFPAQGFAFQQTRATYRLNRRLPDGNLVPIILNPVAGEVTATSHLEGSTSFEGDLGSTYVVTAHIGWLDNNGHEQGSVDLLYTRYQTTIFGPPNKTMPMADACSPPFPATAKLQNKQAIVGSSVPFTLLHFPSDPNVGIYFDGAKIGSVATDSLGNAINRFTVPAAPMGNHIVRFYRFGRNATTTFTIKPRIKVIPNTTARGHTVDVSLRGYAAHETVRIRWKKGSAYVDIARVTTSSTGSANIDVHVPSFAPIGTNSIRGDGSVGHAQSNAVTVLATSSTKSAAKASPTSTKTATPKSTVTTVLSPPTPQSTATSAPAETATPEATATDVETDTPTTVPTESATTEPSMTNIPVESSTATAPVVEPSQTPMESAS